MAIRIRRPREHRELLERLCEGGGKPFNHLYEAILFSAALGYAQGARRPFSETDEPIRWELFSNVDGAEELVNMIAAASADDAEILSDAAEQRRYEMFEEYANGGLNTIAKALAGNPAKLTREVVLDLVLAEQEPESVSIDFESIAKDFS